MGLSMVFVVGFTLGAVSLPAQAVQLAGQVCMECHEDKYSPPVTHYPSQEGVCEVCHTVQRRHFEDMDPKAVKTNRSEQACYQCHEKKDLGKHVHPILQMSGESCIDCHDPHGGSFPTLLKKKLPTLCFDCHDSDPLTRGKSVHKITTAGRSCARCHDSHSSNVSKMLVGTPEKLCLSCHNREIKTSDRLLQNIKAKLDKGASVHAVATECSDCHSAHASQFDRLLTDQFAISDYNRYVPGDANTPNSYELCFKCHDKGMLNRQITDETGFRHDTKSGNQIRRVNLHWVHVTNATGTTGPDRGRSCRLCHDPHGAPQMRLIKDKMFKSGMKLEFAVNATGGSCAKSCHAPKTYQRID